MNQIKKTVRIVTGALGWLLLGAVMMRQGIGPWWIGWGMLAVSGCVLAVSMEDCLSTIGKGWRE